MLILDIRQCRVFATLLIVFACSTNAKVYKRCDLSRDLHFTHGIPLDQVATWVCIAQRESLFNTAAVGRLNTDGSADHGLFQISDSFWCSHDDYGSKACGLLCSDLLDNDIADDVACIKQIYQEHTLLTGDGFNAWTTYQPFCRNQDYKQVDSCFQDKPPAEGSRSQGSINSIQDTNKVLKKYQNNPFLKNVSVQKPKISTQPQGYASSPEAQIVQLGLTNVVSSQNVQPVTNPFLKNVQPHKMQPKPPRYNDIPVTVPFKVKAVNSPKGKIYTRCSLAKELYTKHSFPLPEIATWVCIAEQQSSLNTAAVGRQNGDGSANYGLFQISDRYWCSDDIAEDGGKACAVACNKLMDDDLTDDVRCVRTIYAEHTRIAGDGFNAWTVYQSRCQNQNIEHIRQCFDEADLKGIQATVNEIVPSKDKGKIYQSCELAKELYQKHNMPLEEVATWVCIAQHESNFKTSAVGRLNTDGSADHGLFQISDLYWCTHDRYGGKACNMPCDRLLDSDITDDIRCIKIIYEEHTRISGDGFNAWTVYQPHCRNKGMDNVKKCFTEKELKDYGTKSVSPPSSNSITPHSVVPSNKGKTYSKCELAQELYHTHQMPMEQIPTWVCIAQYESSYNTAAVGRLNTDGSADHGLFQISDLYWCTHDRYGGKACNIPCEKLLDTDISHDVRCIKTIYDEHTRISGDGFTAWTVYNPHCRNKDMDHVKQCFTEKELKDCSTRSTNLSSSNSITPHTAVVAKKGKIYSKCELAKELYHTHQMPMEQIPTWVCIAQHESSYNTSAVGRLNTDGSADHGLFQISDLYWCTHDRHGGKACNIPCDKLLDSDISDDIKCIKIIHDEHTRISGDGFTAWTVYNPHCRNKGIDHVKQCFSEKELKDYGTKSVSPPSSNSITPHTADSTKKGKIYSKCELAKELYHTHHMPMGEIPTWVCIAQHESSYNTAAVGRLNTDGSADHGLFQISDLYWCTHDQHGGKACNIPCGKLLDSDISDDIKCIKIIHDEHTRISGDGFTAWTVYNPHCRNKGMDHVKQCFSEKELNDYGTKSVSPPSSNSITPHTADSTKKGKIYSKCELAKELYHTHHMPMGEIPTWVCIAQHESSYNTAAVGRLNTDGSADHGLFQISDLYWCTHDRYGGKACNIPCDKLLDADISDDIKCIKIIYDEHTRISGDGFTAWTVYKPHCRNQGMDHVKQCFSEKELKDYGTKSVSPPSSNSITPHTADSTKKGKIYSKCELAKELYHTHHMPMGEIPTWVCIAQHESSYNTAAVGRLNTDGSADHGLFQISDLYWCTHDRYGGKACNIPCDKLLDADISDDIKCIKVIYDEHTRISGDGFTAWTVYKPHCRNQGMDHVKQCFSEKELKNFHSKTNTATSTNAIQPGDSAKPSKGKIYKKCELAQELQKRHQMPMEQIPTWVCIAQHESSYNTAAVGRLNTDGSADHGLFQISDLFWCTHDRYGGKACNIPCDKLLDSDISDDVKCIKIIYEEHTQLSGDGFNAWTVYKPHCRNRQLQEISDCFDHNEVELYKQNMFNNVISEIKKPSAFGHYPQSSEIHETTTSRHIKAGQELKTLGVQKTSSYANNPFLQNANKIQQPKQKVVVNVPAVAVAPILSTSSYINNPLLNGAIKTTIENSKPYITPTSTYKTNPFLNGSIKSSVTDQQSQDVGKPNYNINPFLSGSIKTSAVTTSINSNHNPNPYLAGIVQTTASFSQQQTKTTPTVPSVSHQSNTRLVNKSQTSKKYLDSNSFRTKTTTAANSTTTTEDPKSILHSPTTRCPTTIITTPIKNKTTNPTTATQLLTMSPNKGTTVKPFTTTRINQVSKATTTNGPITSWNWQNEKLKQTTTTKRPTTRSSKLTTSSNKGTTVKPFTTTRISQISKATTTKRPVTSWNWQNEKLKQTTTTKRPTTTSDKLTTSRKKETTAKLFTTTGISQVSKATTTKRPTTSWSWENEKLKQNTTTKIPTTTSHKPTTSMIKEVTAKPFITSGISQVSKSTTTKRPVTSWSWENEKLKETTTTKKPTTKVQTTIRKPTAAPSTTSSRKPNSTKTTKPQHITSTKHIANTWNWNDNKTTTKPAGTFPTVKSTTSGTAKTRTPTQSTTKSGKLTTSTSWSWDNENLKQTSSTTTKKLATSPTTAPTPTTSRTTTRKTITTTRPITIPKTTTVQKYPTKASIITTTQSWQSGQLNKQLPSSTTKKPTTMLKSATENTTTSWATTTKTQTPTTKATASWSWNNTKQQQTSSTTTPKPKTTTARTYSTRSSNLSTTTTKKSLATQRTTTKPTNWPTNAWNSTWQNPKHVFADITASHLQTSTQKSSKLQISTAKLQATTTKRPTTRTTWNWQQPTYANWTAKAKSVSKQTTTSWQSKFTTPGILKTSSTTRKPQTTTISWLSGKRIATTKPLPPNSWNVRLGNSNNNETTTTKMPATTILPTTKAVTTTKSAKLQATKNVGQIKTTKATNEQHKTIISTTKNPTIIDNYRKDPFSHPFFDQIRHQFN